MVFELTVVVVSQRFTTTTTTCLAHTRSGPLDSSMPDTRAVVRRAVVSKSISKFKWLALDTSKKDTLITLHARITISIMQFTSITRCTQITHCSCRQVFAEPQSLQQERSQAYRPGLRKVRCRSRPPTSISLTRSTPLRSHYAYDTGGERGQET